MRVQRVSWLWLLLAVLLVDTTILAADKADDVLRRIEVNRGICALVGQKDCNLAIELTKRSELLLYVQLADGASLADAAKAADAAGFYGKRIFLEKATSKRIGLADNLADAVVVPGDVYAANENEVSRILRPGGRVVAGQEPGTRLASAGADDWSHHFHGPDNNPQSRDQLARAPYLTQFAVEPRYAPAPQAAVASAGRLFMAFGHVAWHQREEACMNTLMAINGYNGTLLWKRPLTPGIMVDRCTMVATPSLLYLADDKSCKLLDAATGKVSDEIVLPKELAGGTFWKWIALKGGVLYALIGENEPLDSDARWRSINRGWPWDAMSKLYNEPKHVWGFGKLLVALDPRSKQILWKHEEAEPMDSRALCMTAGRIYCFRFGRYLRCLDAKDGKLLWQRTVEKDREVFQAIGPYRADQGPIQGWKTNMYLKCTDKALYFAGPEVPWLTALSAEDGRVLWKHPVKDLHIVIRDDGLYTIGSAVQDKETKKLDPLTGKVLESYQTRRRSCTRATGSIDSIFFRGHEGSGRFEPGTGKMAWISAMRPSCQVGVVVANGLLYWIPWTCDCNLQMFGVVSVGPAGSFDFSQKATEAERLERAADSEKVAAFASSPNDWPTYRGDNARTGHKWVNVPEQVKLLWQYNPPSPVEATAPTAAGKLVFVAGADGIVRALDAADGKPQWTAYTGGAVRYPPTIADGRALVGSGDGWAYCFEAATGRLLWRFRAAPIERKIPLYRALISTWPVASGVLVSQGTAYFAAGINDFDGSHVYALDAATGRIVWQNNGAGHLDPNSLRGVTCQGELLLHNSRLYLAGGNTVSPGIFEVATGNCLNSPPTSMGASVLGGQELQLVKDQVQVIGQPLYSRSDTPQLDPAYRWANPAVTTTNAAISCVTRRSPKATTWSLVAKGTKEGKVLWEQPLPAEPLRWGMAVDRAGSVIVTLHSGQVLCFGR